MAETLQEEGNRLRKEYLEILALQKTPYRDEGWIQPGGYRDYEAWLSKLAAMRYETEKRLEVIASR